MIESILTRLDASTLILGSLALLMATCYLFVVVGERIEDVVMTRKLRKEYWKSRR